MNTKPSAVASTLKGMNLRKISEGESPTIPKGEVRRRAMFSVPYELIKVEKGFNVRDLSTPDSLVNIASFYQTIVAGGDIPPLELCVNENGEIVLTDGHCRHAAYGQAIKNGVKIDNKPIEEIMLAFEGPSDRKHRTLRMLTSGQALTLSALEAGEGYKRLVDEDGLDNEEIAKLVGRTSEHVKQLLILANASIEVRDFVKEGVISAHSAIDLIRVHGDDTAQFIADQLSAAKEKGMTKVTKGGMEGRALPKKIVSGLVSTVHAFTQRLNKDTRKTLASLESASEEELKGKTVTVDAAALLDLLRVQASIDETTKKQQEKDRAKKAAANQATLEV